MMVIACHRQETAIDVAAGRRAGKRQRTPTGISSTARSTVPKVRNWGRAFLWRGFVGIVNALLGLRLKTIG
jgi:hypothetical protein